MECIYQHINTMGNSSSDLSSSLSDLSSSPNDLNSCLSGDCVIVKVTLPAREGAFGVGARPKETIIHKLEYKEYMNAGRYMVLVKGDKNFRGSSDSSYDEAKSAVNGDLNAHYKNKYHHKYNEPRIYSEVTWPPKRRWDHRTLRGVEHQFRRLHKS